jgi:hypothetical protein
MTSAFLDTGYVIALEAADDQYKRGAEGTEKREWKELSVNSVVVRKNSRSPFDALRTNG